MRAAALLVLVAACAGKPSVRADFPGGSIRDVRRLGDDRFAAAVPGQADHDGRNRQATWYYFRVDGARGREVSITLTDLVGEYDYKPSNPLDERTPPLVSHDGRAWTHVQAVAFDKGTKQLTVRVTPQADRVWIAHVEPYLPERLEALVAEARRSPHAQVETIGRSVQGRDLHLLTITNPAVPEAGKRVVWTMFRQHAWESGSSFAGEGAIRFMLSDDPEAQRLRDQVVFKVFPMLDPDGCAAGGVRFNRNGYDVNRNWDTADPASEEHLRAMPEIVSAKRAFERWKADGHRIDLFMTVHNTETGEYMTGSRRAPELGDRLYRALAETTTFAPGEPAPHPRGNAPRQGRASAPDWVEDGLGFPGFLLEQRISFNPRLGHLPTSQDRLAFGAGLARALCRTALAAN